MRKAHRIVVAGAGIGGLTAALALARRGFAVRVIERAPVFEEAGAGIQLPPNATRVLIDLGLGSSLAACAVTPDALDIRSGPTGAVLATLPLGETVSATYGAPWWVVHRADLQAALLAAVRATPDIDLAPAHLLDGFAFHENGLTVGSMGRDAVSDLPAAALIGADGLWSTVRRLLGDKADPVFRGRTAWRAILPMEAVPPGIPGNRTGLWLGPDAHLVHYPIRGGRALNIVAVISGGAPREGWSGPGQGSELSPHYRSWVAEAQALVAAPGEWLTWALADRPVWFGPGGRAQGPITLMGDAAHPMLPFLAQGGAMAIEDAAVIADACAASRDDLITALRRYEAMRAPRVARVQRGAQMNGRVYHMQGPLAQARDLSMRLIGSRRLASGYDWLYRWTA